MNSGNLARFTALIMASAGLSACTSSPTSVLQGFEPPSTAITFQITDDRPADDKTSKMMSLWVTSCDYGIYRIGDERTTPSRLVFLQRDLEDILGKGLNNSTFDLVHYSTFVNASGQLRDQVNGMYTGVVPSLMTSAGSGCKKEETAGGWFAASEVTTPYPPVIIEIQGTMNDKKYSIRSVYSTVGKPDDPRDVSAVFDAMRKADAMLAKEIAGDLPAQ